MNYKTDDNRYVHWLSGVPNLGNKKKKQLVDILGSEKEVFFAKENTLEKLSVNTFEEDGSRCDQILLTPKQVGQILQVEKKESLLKEWNQLLLNSIEIVGIFDEKYPEKLKTILDSPYSLYYIGELPQNHILTMAVVGARYCSDYGKFMARQYGMTMARAGILLVSGMARGVDGISQRAALEAGGKTYAVLGCGVDICYPVENRELYDGIKKQGGIISEYQPGTLPKPQLFPPRNRIISGLSDGVVVVEAKEKSGTFITVDMALEQGRDVFAVPGRVTDALSKGCNQLIRQGASMATSPQEVISEYFDRGSCGSHNVIKKETEDEKSGENKKYVNLLLTESEKRVLSHLSVIPKSIVQIYEDLNRNIEDLETIISIEMLMSDLINLCEKGLVLQKSLNMYVLCEK